MIPSFSSASSRRSRPAPKPIPGVGGPPICLDEPVVAAAAADRRVGVLVRPDELERRARVVVEPAHERRVDARTGRRRGRAARATASKCARHSSQSDSPIFGASSSAARTDGVLTSNTCSGLVARLCRASSSSTSACSSSQAFSRSTYCGRQFASPIEFRRSSHFVTPEPPQQLVVELDDLRVDRRVGAADRLDGQLIVLAVAAAPGRAVAVHRRDRVRLDRLRLAVHAVLEVRARDRRRALGPQRQRPVAAVGEVVHLLVHDVGGLARRAREEPRVLESRRLDASPAVERGHLLHHARRAATTRHRSAGRRASRAEPGTSSLTSARSARSSRRNGFVCSSRPSVVAGPCPGRTTVSGRKPVEQRAHRVEQRLPVASGRSTRPTDPANSRSPEKSSPSRWNATCRRSDRARRSPRT